MAAAIVIDAFSVQYSPDAPHALSEISLKLPEGSCYAVLGPTGSGKTTLLHALSGILGKHHPEVVSSGSITIRGASYAPLPRKVLFPLVGLALQDPYVQISGVGETVYHEVQFTLDNLGLPPEEGSRRIPPLLGELGIEHLADRKPATLSGGETQRVALATILVVQPTILLLDEPATALDLSAQVKLQRILRSLRDKAAILITDPHIDFALGVADGIVVLDEGRVLFDGTPMMFLSELERFQHILPTAGWSGVMRPLASAARQPNHQIQRIARRLGIV